MATSLTVPDHLDALAVAADRLVGDARAAGLDAKVPTCPGWRVRDLVGHTGGVHRWAAAVLAGGHRENLPDDEIASLMALPPDAELLGWYRSGAELLCDTIRAAPEDLQALVFLRKAPAPVAFWARRQAHEVTIHSVDALAARIGHQPTTAQADVDRELAVDGIDELLTGFVTRRSSRLRTAEPFVVTVTPTDAEVAWTVRLSADQAVTTDGADAHADAVVSGTAADLYLGLWNRGDEIAVDGEPEFLGEWRDKVRIRWS